jgi:hypothetical protein
MWNMATYRVLPLSDGVSQRYGWQVQKDGRRVSKHHKKSGAKRKARSLAGASDSVVMHRIDGTVMSS